jgi:glycine dehydrogenase
MAAFYMQWHGRVGLRKIAKKTRFFAQILMEELSTFGFVFATDRECHFDTVAIDVKKSGFSSADYLLSEFHKYGINIRKIDDNHVSVSFDELSTLYDLDQLIEIFINLKADNGGTASGDMIPWSSYENRVYRTLPEHLRRGKQMKFMGEQQFRMQLSETNMMRYIVRLCEKDVSLTNSMVALGSCTMKLNSAITMIPVTWSGFADLHPFVPRDQC